MAAGVRNTRSQNLLFTFNFVWFELLFPCSIPLLKLSYWNKERLIPVSQFIMLRSVFCTVIGTLYIPTFLCELNFGKPS
jgi:hypothetical protein